MKASITLYMEKSVIDDLTLLADGDGRSISNYTERALEPHLQENSTKLRRLRVEKEKQEKAAK